MFFHNLLAIRQKLKERLAEEKELGLNAENDTQKFITSAYKKKLQEEQKWDYEDKLNQALEQHNDAKSKREGMLGFYSNLLTKNIAMGSEVATSAVSAYTAGSSRHAQYTEKVDEALTSEQAGVSAPVLSNVSPSAEKTVVKNTPATNHKRSLSPEASLDHVATTVNITDDSAATSHVLPKPENREDVVSAARLRFLERKKMKTT